MVKTPKNLLLRNQESFKAESWYIVSGTQGPPSLTNDYPRMTFDLSMARSNLHPHNLEWGKCGNTGRKLHGICRYAMAVLLW